MHSFLAGGSVCLRKTLSDCGAPNVCFRPTDVRFRDLKQRGRTDRRLTVAHANTECDMAERVLRYPDGHVRTIRYPEPAGSHSPRDTRGSAIAATWSQPPSPPSPQGDWHICSELDDSCCFDAGFVDDLPGAAPVEELWGARRDTDPACTDSLTNMPEHDPQQPLEEFGALPSSPAALLEYISSEKFSSQRRKLLEQVASSYEVLHGCPWIYPRRLLTIAIRKEGQEAPSSYTLPIAIEQEGGAGEMAKLLKKPHLEQALQMRQLQDGIIVFDCDMAASTFVDSLQAAGSLTATLTEVDSHELFRAAADAKASVVLVCGGDSASRGTQEAEFVAEWPSSTIHRSFDFVPTPSQLAAELRGKASMEES